jgi:hypothetical protein
MPTAWGRQYSMAFGRRRKFLSQDRNRYNRLGLCAARSLILQREHRRRVLTRSDGQRNDRIFPAGVTCGSSGAPPCLYTTVPVWQIDESAKTATLTFHQIVPTALYSNFGGNAEQLANSNVEYDLCGVGTGSYVYEVTQESSPQTVWTMHVTGTNLYRAFRIPSLYPEVQW